MQPLLIVANLNQAALSCTVPSAPTSPANRFFFTQFSPGAALLAWVLYTIEEIKYNDVFQIK